MKIKPLTLLSKHLSDTHTHTQCTHPCSNQCWLETENCNDQNFLERLSWSALLLNLVPGDLPGDAPLPARGDMLGYRKRDREKKNSASVFKVDCSYCCLSKTIRWTLMIIQKYLHAEAPFYILLLPYSPVVMSLTKKQSSQSYMSTPFIKTERNWTYTASTCPLVEWC